MIDTHLHSHYSYDSDADISEIARALLGAGATYAAVTDHVDFNYPLTPFAMWDIQAYFKEILLAKNICPSLRTGVEIGFMGTDEPCAVELAKNPFDFIINSVHTIDGKDPYFLPYFEGKDKKTAYTQYFLCVRKSLNARYRYDSVGHIGYVARKAPYSDRDIYLKEFGDILEDIFNVMIAKDKILEINTSAYMSGKFLPSEPLLRRYYELGGRLVTFGSDAHCPQAIGAGFGTVTQVLRAIGFDALYGIIDNKPAAVYPL